MEVNERRIVYGAQRNDEGDTAVDRSHASTRGRPHGRQNFKPPFMLFCKLPSSHRGIRSLSSTILPAERVRKVPEMNRQALARTSLPLQAHSLVRARARSRRGRRPGTAHGTSSASAVCPSRARKSHRGEPTQAPLWNVHVQQGRQSAHGVYAWQLQKSTPAEELARFWVPLLFLCGAPSRSNRANPLPPVETQHDEQCSSRPAVMVLRYSRGYPSIPHSSIHYYGEYALVCAGVLARDGSIVFAACGLSLCRYPLMHWTNTSLWLPPAVVQTYRWQELVPMCRKSGGRNYRKTV